MNLFSKNNYKYFIGFLIAFIFIILVYGNYNLKINVIENSQNMNDPSTCPNDTSVNTDNFSDVGTSENGSQEMVTNAVNITLQANCDAL